MKPCQKISITKEIIICFIFAGIFVLLPSLASADIIVSQLLSDSTQSWFYGATYGLEKAQTFTPLTDAILSGVTIKLYRVGNYCRDISVDLMSVDDNGLPLSVLQSGSPIPTASITTDPAGAEYTSTFSGYNLIAGTTYAIRFSSYCPYQYNYIYMMTKTGNPYPNGALLERNNQSPYNWSTVSTKDAWFKILGQSLPTPIRLDYNLYPNAAGDLTQCTVVGASTNWDAVNEKTANDDLDYVYVTTIGELTKLDSYKIDPFNVSYSVINKVTLRYRLKVFKGYATNAYARPFLRIGGTNYFGTYRYPGSTWQDWTDTWTKNPATGLDWTASDINNMQIGIELTALGNTYFGNSASSYCTQIYAIVNYTPAPLTITNSIGPSNVSYNSARLNCEITEIKEGENPIAHIYWGDNDGGNTPTNWDHDENLGVRSLGTFYKDITGLNRGTTYYYRCYASNSAGFDWADNSSSFTTIPLAPTLLSPANNSYASGNSITFKWNPAAGATKYRLEVNTDPNWGTATRKFYQEVGNITQYTVSGFPEDGTIYYWRVWAGNEIGWCTDSEANSNSQRFINLGIPGAPTLISPLNKDTEGSDKLDSDTSVTFKWSAPAGAKATKYRLEVNTDPNWGTATRKFYQEVGNITQYTVSGFPEDGTIYYWRVWAGNEIGWGPSSESRSFVSALKPSWLNSYGITGKTCADPGGNYAEYHEYFGRYIVVDTAGDPYAGGLYHKSGVTNCGSCCGFDYRYMLAVGYDKTNGNRKWVSTHMPDNYYMPSCQDMEAGLDGNIYAITDRPIYFYKYNPVTGLASGFPIALYPSGDPYAGRTYLYKTEVDKNGYIYGVGGWLQIVPPTSYSHDVLVKINPSSGNKIWERQYTTAFAAEFYDLAFDDLGNIYVLQKQGGGTIPMLYQILKYDPNGNLFSGWPKTNSFGTGADRIFVKGSNFYITNNNSTVKYDLNGNQVKRIGEGGTKMVFDNQGNIYINVNQNSVKKYDSNLNLIWSLAIPAKDLEIDNANNIYVYDGVTTIRKYDSNRNWIWTGSSLLFTGAAFTVDKSAQVAYITGSADIYYGKAIVTAKFGTPSAPLVNPPRVSTELAVITNLQNNTVTLRGTIIDNGGASIDKIKFVWGTSSGNYPFSSGEITYTGNFEYNLTGITDGTIYYYKAQAHNSAGWSDLTTTNERSVVIYTAYGEDRSFSTQQPSQPTNLSEGWNHCSIQGTSKVTLYWQWQYSPQVAYQVLIDNNPDFSSPEIDSCNSALSGGVNTCQSGNSSQSYTPIPNLAWATTYYWKVRVKDDRGSWSSWSASKSFPTPAHAYPWPDFDWSPKSPTKGEIVQFINRSSWYGSTEPTYTWNFGDGATSNLKSPTHAYSNQGTYSVKLRACDEVGCCDTDQNNKTKRIKIFISLPGWREIVPF